MQVPTVCGSEAATGVVRISRMSTDHFHNRYMVMLAKGMPPRELMAELFGRATGCSRGRGGSMHLFSPEIGMMGTSGIVGPCILQACGGGYSSKLHADRPGGGGVLRRRSGQQRRVSRRAQHGQHLEAAGVVRLREQSVRDGSAVLLFERHSRRRRRAAELWHAGVRGRRQRRIGRVSKCAAKRWSRARAGEGPTLIECKTYRTRAHAEGMGDFTYRTREEVEQWKQRCPIAALRSTGC